MFLHQMTGSVCFVTPKKLSASPRDTKAGVQRGVPGFGHRRGHLLGWRLGIAGIAKISVYIYIVLYIYILLYNLDLK